MIEIKTKHGETYWIDDEDADLALIKWSGDYARSGSGVKMHHVVIERVLGRPLTSGEMVDHKDTNSRNNRRSNLRLATFSQNNSNRRRPINATSPYRGVRMQTPTVWTASITANKKLYRLGKFPTPEAARDAYQEAAVQLRGEFARFD